MTEHDVYVLLREYWIANAPQSSRWDDDEVAAGPNELALRTSIRGSANVSMTVGRTREEHRGTITVEVQGPRSVGPGQVERLASSCAAAWRAFAHPRVKLTVPSVVGLGADGAFIRLLVTLGWRADLRS